MGVGGRLAALALGGIVGLQTATQYVGWAFRWPEAPAPTPRGGTEGGALHSGAADAARTLAE